MAYSAYICKYFFSFSLFCYGETFPETEHPPTRWCLLCSAGWPKRHRSFWWESFSPRLAHGAVPPLGLGLMSWINACHASTVRDTPLSHPAWTISTPILPPPVSLPTVFTPLLEELGLASLQSHSQSTTVPPSTFAQDENHWCFVHKPLSNDVKAQRCHISMQPVRGRVSVKSRRVCSCMKGCVILLSISWTPRRCELTRYLTHSIINLRLQSFSLTILKKNSFEDASNSRFWFKRGPVEQG